MSTAKKEFNAVMRGYHHYKKDWNPKPNEKLSCSHETGNPFDVFPTRACNTEDNIIGHLLREISRETKFLLDRGADITAIPTETHYRRSSLIQGGVEITCLVKVEMHPS